MKKRARVVTGLFAILALLFLWAYHLAERHRLEASLGVEATGLLDDYGWLAHDDVSLEVAAGRTLPLLGDVWGKVTVFRRTATETGSPDYQAIEHFYAYNNGTWQMTESGGCSGDDCQIRAQKAFKENALSPIQR